MRKIRRILFVSTAMALVLRLPPADGKEDDRVPVDRAPVADAGDHQIVQEDSLVTLDGGGSVDPDGDALVYEWRQTAGRPIALFASGGAHASFRAPRIAGAGETLVFTLTVTDSGGGESTDEVRIAVIGAGALPVTTTRRSPAEAAPLRPSAEPSARRAPETPGRIAAR
jgi:K319L-like, PKD domain